MAQVHHITPGRSDKNFGKSVNVIVRGLPDEDWICLRDIDTLPVYHEAFFAQCEAITHKDVGLVGCMTNRVGLSHQLHGGVLSDRGDYMYHRQIAISRFASYGALVDISELYIAGFFMLFPKKTWTEIGGFPEGGVSIGGKFVDWWVCDKVSKAGLKIGIAPGIYLFHAYRSWKNNKDIKHLL